MKYPVTASSVDPPFTHPLYSPTGPIITPTADLILCAASNACAQFCHVKYAIRWTTPQHPNNDFNLETFYSESEDEYPKFNSIQYNGRKKKDKLKHVSNKKNNNNNGNDSDSDIDID